MLHGEIEDPRWLKSVKLLRTETHTYRTRLHAHMCTPNLGTNLQERYDGWFLRISGPVPEKRQKSTKRRTPLLSSLPSPSKHRVLHDKFSLSGGVNICSSKRGIFFQIPHSRRRLSARCALRLKTGAPRLRAMRGACHFSSPPEQRTLKCIQN